MILLFQLPECWDHRCVPLYLAWFFEKVYKVDKPLASLANNKKEKTQILTIRDETENVNTVSAENKQLYTHSFFVGKDINILKFVRKAKGTIAGKTILKRRIKWEGLFTLLRIKIYSAVA
jgi:hypothetical protein